MMAPRTVELCLYGALMVVGGVGLVVGHWLERRAQRRAQAALRLTLDTTAWDAALARLRADMERTAGVVGQALLPAFRRFTQELGRMMRRYAPALELPLTIARHGPRNVTGDGLWQCDMCAGWLHDSCPSARCDCTCRGGSLR